MYGNVSSTDTLPSSADFINMIRPRGESISSPSSRYVGHADKQKPQCTQALIASLPTRPTVVRIPNADHNDIAAQPAFGPALAAFLRRP